MSSRPRGRRQRKEIEIVITPDGNVSMETHGARGKSCLKLTQWLEEELGEVVSRELKGVYYQREELTIEVEDREEGEGEE